MSDYFGQSPDGYQKPLYAASNFSDVVDKPAALVNLGAASADDVLKAANPIGTIIAFYGSVAPYGYLPCSGQTVSSSTFPSLVTFLGGTTSATLPDLRGEFLRGWDNGRGIDTGRTIRSNQKGSLLYGNDDNGAEVHGLNSISANRAGLGWDVPTITEYSGVGTYTNSGVIVPGSVLFSAAHYGTSRPRNVSVLYCIKAYDSPVNAGILNVATLASEMALKTALADFTGTNQTKANIGYQKLPGGMIIQWGESVTTSGTGNLVFPIAFPTAAAQFIATATASSPANYIVTCGSLSPSNISVFTTGAVAGSTPVAIAIGYRWVVLGY
jgi:phage-related tail fiber protein